METGLSARIGRWLKKPYSDDMSVAGWFAFLAMLAILTFLWSRVIRFTVNVINDAA